jgi:hypothetical protein
VKLFQIEEPEGGPTDPRAPGAAIGIDAAGTVAEVAMSVGGNAAVLTDREGFEQALTVPAFDGAIAEWRELFEGARLRAERALARPVTHAVIVFAELPDAAPRRVVAAAAEQAELTILRVAAVADLASSATSVLAAAILAEDLAPRPDSGVS